MIGKLIMSLMHARTAAHVLHLQSRSCAEHVALGAFYGELVPLLDAFAEQYQGEYGLIKEFPGSYKHAASPLDLLDDLRECIDEHAAGLDKEDTHLLAALDDIRSLISSTAYKLRFLK